MDGSILHKCFTANLKNDYHSQTKNSWLYFNPLLKGCFHPSEYSLDGTFLVISRWSFRSLRGKVWEIKTLTVSAKNHTQNTSIIMEGNIRAPQSQGATGTLKQFFLTVAKPVALKHQRAPESPGGPVGDGWALPCVWFSRSGGARKPWCWSRGSAVSISPFLLLIFSLLDLAKTASLGEHLPDPNCSILCLKFFYSPNLATLSSAYDYLQWQENFFFWSQVCFAGLVKNLKLHTLWQYHSFSLFLSGVVSKYLTPISSVIFM